MPRCKVEDRWRLTDNILRMTRLYIPKKGKVNFMNLGWGSQPHRSNIISQPYELMVRKSTPPLYIFVKDPALPLKFVIPTFISVRVQKIFSHTRLKLPAFGVDFLTPEFIRFTFAFFGIYKRVIRKMLSVNLHLSSTLHLGIGACTSIIAILHR